jgi:hypothetical protein
MKPVILFRKSIDTEAELTTAARHFKVTSQRVGCVNRLVVGRYSVLPFYDELEADLEAQGSRLINSAKQHHWIASFAWYDALQAYTPRTWFSPAKALERNKGPWVLKGRTNSRKHDWNRSMFAADAPSFWRVYGELTRDEFIGRQELVFREYVPLKVLETGLNGLPFSNEWRFFFYRRSLLNFGYYWSSALPETIERAEMKPEGMELARKCANIAADHANFFVLDVAETAEGRWTLIEVNDGQCSGLSENAPDTLYANLSSVLRKDWYEL